MQRLLTEEEYQALTPELRVARRDRALAKARTMIVPDEQCFEIHYCSDCPIGQIESRDVRNLLCTKQKNWPK